MDANLIAPIFSALGVIVTALSGYWVAKRNAKKDIAVNDRQLLSQDERDFRSIILQENKELRERLETLTVEFNQLKVENGRLQLRILGIEGKQAVSKVIEGGDRLDEQG